MRRGIAQSESVTVSSSIHVPYTSSCHSTGHHSSPPLRRRRRHSHNADPEKLSCGEDSSSPKGLGYVMKHERCGLYSVSSERYTRCLDRYSLLLSVLQSEARQTGCLAMPAPGLQSGVTSELYFHTPLIHKPGTSLRGTPGVVVTAGFAGAMKRGL